MKNLVLTPAGRITKELLTKKMKKDVNCICICDNDEKKWGEEVSGIPIVSFEEIKKYEVDRVLIMSDVFETADSIKQQLYKAGIYGSKVDYSYGISSATRCKTVLDEFFDIEKLDIIPFEIKPAEIYMEYKGETFKSIKRREREGFYEKYCNGLGLDIGYGADVIKDDACGWDIRNGDAQFLEGIKDETFDYVYSSHCLEHLYDVRTSISNWFRVVKKGGYLIIAVPHRDLYEKKKMIPSRWNLDHKHMFLLGDKDDVDTLDIIEEVRESIENYRIMYAKTCDYGHTNDNPLTHSDGEYQIEIVIKKM